MFGLGKGLDPEKTAKVKEVTQRISAKITTDFNDDTITISFSTDDPQARAMIEDRMMGSLSKMLATQLSSFFGIQGELINVKKRD